MCTLVVENEQGSTEIFRVSPAICPKLPETKRLDLVKKFTESFLLSFGSLHFILAFSRGLVEWDGTGLNKKLVTVPAKEKYILHASPGA